MLWFALGLLVGLAVGALAVRGALRSVARITGADGRGAARLVVDGLRPGQHGDGVAAQRALARRLRRTGGRAASGRRVAASDVEIHVSPEVFALLDEALGVERATDDLLEYYRAYASRSGWLVQGEPRIVLVRDISLRPRQSFARATTRAEPTARPAARVPADPEVRPRVPVRPDVPVRAVPGDAVTDVLPRGLGAGVPDVPPRAGEEATTLVLPPGELDLVGPGGLVVVHGTDVRTVPAARGRVTIGRAPHNDLVLDRPSVARDHVAVERRGSDWWVVPGEAASGTVLDGRGIDAPAAIDGQALLELGRGVRVRLSVEPAA